MNWPDDYINKVICGDCLEIMQGIPDGAVDLVVTDPPYGIKINAKDNTNKMQASPERARKAKVETWDSQTPTKPCFDEVMRVSKHQIIFGANYFWEYLHSTPCYIVWDKVGQFKGLTNFAHTEFAWCSMERMSRKYTVVNQGFVRDSEDERLHPTQKPTELMRPILADFSSPDQIILDPFAGSGTTLVAAKQLGRKYIGIEINPDYCKIAEQRLSQEELFA